MAERKRPKDIGFNPHVEFFGIRHDVLTSFPVDFRQRFKSLSENIYPQNLLQKLQSEGYNPHIIGYSHADPEEMAAITQTLAQIKRGQHNRSFKVLQEIDPQGLQWIREFLEAESEFNQYGTIGGESARPDEIAALRTYTDQLRTGNASYLSLWFLENGDHVKSIEHPDVKKWIQKDRRKPRLRIQEDNDWFATDLQSYYTAIQRDIHGLQVIEQERPDVISVGSMHALKYDMLLNRDGQKSFYFLDRPFDWEMVLKHWQYVHVLYK